MKTGLLLVNNKTVIDVIDLVSTEGVQRVPRQLCDILSQESCPLSYRGEEGRAHRGPLDPIVKFWSRIFTKISNRIWFLPRCMQCRRGLAMRILSVCLSVRLSVCLSVCHTRVL